MSLIFVDVEAHFDSPCPGIGGGMTEFGAVEFNTKHWFHGQHDRWASSNAPAWNEMSFDGDKLVEIRGWDEIFYEFNEWLHKFKAPHIFVSDNPAYDWQWINYHFHHTLGRNPFGHSARRIGDFYAGLVGNFRAASKWKKLRITKHTHNPVDDAMGNCEAFARMLAGER